MPNASDTGGSGHGSGNGSVEDRLRALENIQHHSSVWQIECADRMNRVESELRKVMGGLDVLERRIKDIEGKLQSGIHKTFDNFIQDLTINMIGQKAEIRKEILEKHEEMQSSVDALQAALQETHDRMSKQFGQVQVAIQKVAGQRGRLIAYLKKLHLSQTTAFRLTQYKIVALAHSFDSVTTGLAQEATG